MDDPLEDVVGESLEGAFLAFDEAFWTIEPSVVDVLQRHLQEHQEWYVEVVGSSS